MVPVAIVNGGRRILQCVLYFAFNNFYFYPMFLNFLKIMLRSNNTDVSKTLKDKLYKSAFVYMTRPFSVGSKISIENTNGQAYSGNVQDVGILYVKLRDYKRTVYVPTSFIYDKIIYTDK